MYYISFYNMFCVRENISAFLLDVDMQSNKKVGHMLNKPQQAI